MKHLKILFHGIIQLALACIVVAIIYLVILYEIIIAAILLALLFAYLVGYFTQDSEPEKRRKY